MSVFNPSFVFENEGSDFLPRKSEIIPPSLPLKKIENEDKNLETDALIEKYKNEMLNEFKDGCFSSEDNVLDKSTNLLDFIRANKKLSKKKSIKIEDETSISGEVEEKYQFSGMVTMFEDVASFLELKLSRPILKALTDMNLDKPTPIQCSTIPIALLGRDICACARTGSGKTLAFLLPILDRMVSSVLINNKAANQTKCLIVSPTRELAIQIFKVTEMLVKYSPRIRVQLATGGLNLETQEASLRKCPDIVIATPGRLIDHISNAPNFTLSSVEYLVLDEADKLLDENFFDQLAEIVRNCSPRRQTLLFSATMTESMKELVSLSLQSPIRVFLNQSTALATEIHHEFIRIRPQREEDRETIVAALLLRNFPSRTIVFLRTKKQCHRVHILFGLIGIKCGELHGDMTQEERLSTLQRFLDSANLQKDSSNSKIDVLLATDLAARGLDIPNIETVINFSLPPTMKQYVHRVGRTARANASGRAVSLAGESDRKLLKEIVRETKYPVKSRTIPPTVIQKINERIKKLEPVIKKILDVETAQRDLKIASKQLEEVDEALVNKISVRERKNWFDEQRDKKKLIKKSSHKNNIKRNLKLQKNHNKSHKKPRL